MDLILRDLSFAYLTANQLAATTISVAFGSALALYVVSQTVLRKKQ